MEPMRARRVPADRLRARTARTRRPGRRGAVRLAAVLAAALAPAAGAAETWRGLVVAPESRCSPYRSKDYRYPQSVEGRIVAGMGGRVYGPYTGRTFANRRQTDIEHMVARSEAHDSGLCAADAATRRRFSSDPLNLTLAAPEINRCGGGGKCAKDAAEWLPPKNRCWFAARVVEVRRKYRLTVDRREAARLESVLSRCASTAMAFHDGAVVAPVRRSPPAGKRDAALDRWDDNGNGRITCAEARRHGIAPVPRGHPAYRFMRDGDGDGVVCE